MFAVLAEKIAVAQWILVLSDFQVAARQEGRNSALQQPLCGDQADCFFTPGTWTTWAKRTWRLTRHTNTAFFQCLLHHRVSTRVACASHLSRLPEACFFYAASRMVYYCSTVTHTKRNVNFLLAATVLANLKILFYIIHNDIICTDSTVMFLFQLSFSFTTTESNIKTEHDTVKFH